MKPALPQSESNMCGECHYTEQLYLKAPRVGGIFELWICGGRMLLSVRPLVSVTVLTLLGWCWYSFRRRRKIKASLWTGDEECLSDGSSPVYFSPADNGVLGQSDPKMDQNISRSPEITELTDTSQFLEIHKFTSTSPIIGLNERVRPEPEGEVSIRFPEPNPSKKEENDFTGEVHQEWGEVHQDDFTDEKDGSTLSDFSPERSQENMEMISPVLVQQVIQTAENQHSSDPLSRLPNGGFQSASQDLVQHQSISGDDNGRETGSFRKKLLRDLGASIGDDSGCGSSFSEDVSGAERLTCEISEEEQSFLMTESDTASIDGKMIPSILGAGEEEAWHGVESCVVADTQMSSLAPPPAPPIIQWDIEVPAHLVGRLIGKQGKFMNFLKQSSGAQIYVSTLPFTPDIQICHIQGSQQQVDEALSLVRKKFKDLDLSNCAPLPCLPITSWLLLPQDVFVEVMVSRVEAAHHLFVHQYSHPSHQVLPTLIQAMQLCYSQPGCPSLPTPVEVGVVCAAPVTGSGWQRAQVIQYDGETATTHIRYVDSGGYDTVNSTTLRQIRSDFVTLPFQAAEVLLDNIMPLPGDEEFSLEAKEALEESTANVALILKVTGSQDGLPLVHLWKQTGDEMVLINKSLADQGFFSWFDPQ
ncbi:A-kinase anchor protein 1, mitochondrial [Danio aesculapii]|uniref:A-kinase anchor protein 1, mitochondrial n=1 Tax=Danio aesculapii TaxID=1142201 RepID=UPI0024BFAE9E|nr:A-kinase anchor protein 1, mitochondrial [Danio aesculapii]